jgi:hypothetical protein
MSTVALFVCCSAGLAMAANPSSSFDRGAGGGDAPAVRGAMVQLAHPAFPGSVVLQLGTSTQGRPITAANRRGSVTASRTIVVVGVIHGDERQGRSVTDRLMTATLPAEIDLWIVPTMNPDGESVGGHRNANGVDLNRNWPVGWESGTLYSSGRYYSGPAAGSERETQVMMDFFRSVEPAVTVWYHSPWNMIDCDVARVGQSCLTFAAAVGRPAGFAPRPGTATDWLMTSGFGASFVAEFGSTTPSAAQVQMHVDAIVNLP